VTSVVRSVVTCQADADVSLPFPSSCLLSLFALTPLYPPPPSPTLYLSLILSCTSSLYPLSPPPFSPPLSNYLLVPLSPSLSLFPPLVILNITRGRNPIHATLSLSYSASGFIPSRLSPRDRLLLSSTPYASRGFSSLFRIYPHFPSSLCQLPSSTLSFPLALFSNSAQRRTQTALFRMIRFF